MQESFEDRVFKHLREKYPDLDEGFIRRNPKALMDMLGVGAQHDSIDASARSIPDFIPAALLDGISSTVDGSENINTVTAKEDLDGRIDCITLLSMYMQRVLAGDIKGLCIMALRDDSNHEMVFTVPCNLLSYYGFMTYALGLAMHSSGETNQ